MPSGIFGGKTHRGVHMLQNKVALVTGASRGIGARTAVELAKAGCQVAVNYHRSAAQAHRVLQEIWAFDGKAAAFQGDVSDPASCRSMVEQVIQTFGTVPFWSITPASTGTCPSWRPAWNLLSICIRSTACQLSIWTIWLFPIWPDSIGGGL